LVEEKKKFDSEFLSYNLMLNSGKKIRALCDKRNKYSNSCVVKNNCRDVCKTVLRSIVYVQDIDIIPTEKETTTCRKSDKLYL
jgi:hypothetical protein